jgi:hypothetical protein
MNIYTSCIYLLFTLINPAPKLTNGYIVAWNNDTSIVQIILPTYNFGLATYDINKKLLFIDSTNTRREYFSRDIKSFGFQENTGVTIYRLKPIQNGTDLFLKGTVIGNRANLFEYVKGSGDRIFFTLEKANSYYLFLDSDEKTGVIKEKLKSYLIESPEILNFIDRKFVKSSHIPEDLREIVKAFNQ